MVKTTDLVQNLYNLKLCMEYELEVGYNLILDFPGTTDEHIQQMIDILPLIVHLPPPTALCRFVLYKEAPIFRQPGLYGISDCHPSLQYRLALGELYGSTWPATRYDYHCNTAPSDAILESMDSACATWADDYDPKMSLLSVEYNNIQAIVVDRRTHSRQTYNLRGESLQCLRYCDEPRLADSLNTMFMTATIRELVEKNLLVVDNNRVLSLPVSSRKRKMARRGRPDSEFASTTNVMENLCTLTSR
jgi:magnesium-protoporphyrin IX monomethyl ester (oxidative) cyclase